jgi:hypothetical protein
VPVAACGGGSSLTKAELLKQGDAICATLTKSSAAVAQPANDKAKAAYLGKIVALAKRARADFADLDAPSAGTAVQKQLVDSLDTSIRTASKAQAAAAKGDFDLMGKLLETASKQGKAADAAAEKFGFSECGSL